MSSAPGNARLRVEQNAAYVLNADSYGVGVALGPNDSRATMVEVISGVGSGPFNSALTPSANTRLVMTGGAVHLPAGVAAAASVSLEVVAGGNAILGIADALLGSFSAISAPMIVLPGGAGVPVTATLPLPGGSQIVTSPGDGASPVHRIVSTVAAGVGWSAFVHFTVINVADNPTC